VSQTKLVWAARCRLRALRGSAVMLAQATSFFFFTDESIEIERDLGVDGGLSVTGFSGFGSALSMRDTVNVASKFSVAGSVEVEQRSFKDSISTIKLTTL
jgi:hypothetical protein